MSEYTSLEQVLCKISDPTHIAEIFDALLTPKEIVTIKERWRVCQMLHAGKSYRQINQEVGASFTTINRVARCLQMEGNSGYRFLLQEKK